MGVISEVNVSFRALSGWCPMLPLRVFVMAHIVAGILFQANCLFVSNLEACAYYDLEYHKVLLS